MKLTPSPDGDLHNMLTIDMIIDMEQNNLNLMEPVATV